MRRSCQEDRRVVGENISHCGGDDLCELIIFDPIPSIKDEAAIRLQHASCFSISLLLVGEEHDAELTDHSLERAIWEWQRLRIHLLPAHVAGRGLRSGMVKHRLVQVGRDYTDATAQ